MNRIFGTLQLDSRLLTTSGRGFVAGLPYFDDLSIAADVRLDNQAELAVKLGLAGRARTASCPETAMPDHQLVLAAYKKWGQDCAFHLLGDFAFVICDAAQRCVYAARDHLGVRPFFYCHRGSVFTFASSASDVAAAQNVPAEINLEKLAGFLLKTVSHVTNTETWFKHVQRLPPGHQLMVDRSGLKRRRYWNLDPGRELVLSSDREYVDAFEEVLSRAVQDRLAGSGGIASMLSGGLDSSIIVGLASRQLSGTAATPLPTYSGITNEPGCVESGCIRTVIAHCNVQPTLIVPAEVSLYEQALKRADERTSDPSDSAFSLLQLLFLKAKTDGHSSLLSGVDGDCVASLGPDYAAYLLRSGKVLTAARELRGQNQNYYRRSKPSGMDYLRLFRRATAPGVLRRLKTHSSMASRVQIMVDKSLISESLSKAENLEGRLKTYLEEFGNDMSPSLRHAHVNQIHWPYLVGGAELYARLASNFGMECRHPLLDKRLVEFCVSLPWNQKRRYGWSKYAMRRVAARVLPEAVAWRPGFEDIGWEFVVARSQLNRKEELETAPELARAYKGVVNVDKVDQRLHKLRGGEVGADIQLIQFLSLASWLRRQGINGL